MKERVEITYKEFENAERVNKKFTKEHLKDHSEAFEKLFNIEQKLFYNHVDGFTDPYYGFEEYEKIIIQSFLKTNYLLYTAHKLTLQGNYGAANIFIRQIFEFLILGKYVSIKKDSTMAIKWLGMNQFDVHDKVIRLLAKPSKKSFHDYWIIICKFAHATTSSYQLTLDYKFNKQQIQVTQLFLLLFLRCNYHLLSSCLLNKKLVYRSEVFGNFKKQNYELKKEAKAVKIYIYDLYTEHGKQLIKDYETSWVFKK